MGILRPTAPVMVQRVYRPGVSNTAGRVNGEDRGVGSSLVTIRAQEEKQNPLMKALVGVRWGVRWLINGPTVAEFKTRVVTEDPDTRWANQAELRSAAAGLITRKPAELLALAKLPAPKAEAYRQAVQLCNRDIMAADALQRMLLDGRLTGTKDFKGTGDMLDHLARIATQPLAPGLDRAELLTSVIEEAENPTKLAQEGKGTCAATVPTMVLARKNPSEYVRLIADLASPAGSTVTTGGATLTRDADWANDNDGGRTPSMQLISPALMDLGNGILRYDNDHDVHTLAEKSSWDKVKDFFDKARKFVKLPGGLGSGGSDKCLEQLTGDKYGRCYIVSRLNRAYAWNNITQQLAKGHSVPVGLEWEGGGHKLLLDKVEGDTAFYTNPWGQKEKMNISEFKANLMEYNLPKF